MSSAAPRARAHPLRILQVHESYVYRGGEDETADTELIQLERSGHEVHSWRVDNKVIEGWSPARKARLLWETTWSISSRHELRRLMEAHTPDIVHFHNTLPLISPAALRLAHGLGAAVVLSLHNYRLLCPAGTFLRNGHVCEDCVSHSLARGVVHGCYRGSRVQTLTVATMLAIHRRLGTWTRCVDAFIALTSFMKEKMVAGGLPAERIHVRHNPVLAESRPGAQARDAAVLFAGRLTLEKGVGTLLGALPALDGTQVRVAGTGPMAADVAAAARAFPQLEVLGQLSWAETMARMSRAAAFIAPSIWYEGLPRTILEALACGTPVVASRIGAHREMITDGHDGFLFDPGDARDLAAKIRRLTGSESLRNAMSAAARDTFESRYSETSSHDRLLEIYQRAMDSARARRAA